ncbi:hypothetical protein [Epilithonimonas sp.]|uniref:hypothetical protein n=1 Tax=Epilithonimonas sp. TaxID=2894511 RepID=UPI00289D5504|nr:hypothetical protein [Epilithonimonas sp.]
MPFLNFETRHFSQEEIAAATDALQNLHTALTGKLASLTPEERQQYGSINEQNKLLVNKVNDYRNIDPQLSSPEVDWEEFSKDYKSRNFLESITNSLAELSRGLENAKILHDWDNYQASLIDYQYSVYRNDSGSTGFHTKVQEIKQFFGRTGSKDSGDATATTE